MQKSSLPAKQEKMTAAESTAEGQNDPAESFFDGIAAAYTSELNRPAMRTSYGKHSGYIALSV